MEQETMPSTDDYQKAFLVFYPGENARGAFNAILRSALTLEVVTKRAGHW